MKNVITNFFQHLWAKPPEPPTSLQPKKSTIVADLPKGGRVSRPDVTPTELVGGLKRRHMIAQPDYIRKLIPVIRSAAKVNPDIGQALWDTVQLINTGHKVYFDDSVPLPQVEKMRKHLRAKGKTWGDGVAGIHGLVNKMIYQIMVGGALSLEWVPENGTMGELPKTITNAVLVNIETIEFSWNKKKLRFEAYQRRPINDSPKSIGHKLVKLNPRTFSFYTLMGDEENPYPIPPYLTALKSLNTGGNMDLNVEKIMDQLGLLGFLEVGVEVPNQKATEPDGAYQRRITDILNKVKTRTGEGMKDGIVVGVKDQHEFDFHSTSKDLQGVDTIYYQNKRNTATGLKQPPEFMNVIGGKGSETSITVIFSKMVSQSKNIQAIVAYCLEFGYALELKLQGFNFDNLKVKFQPSTISDDLKLQQAVEIKIRNHQALYSQGIISQEQFADIMGFDKPAKKEPRPTQNNPLDDAAKKQKREADKDKSDRKVRDKNKPVPKDKDADGKKS